MRSAICSYAPHPRCSESEGRGGQDHHHHQPRRRAGAGRAACAAGRPRSPGQRDHGQRRRQARPRAHGVPRARRAGRAAGDPRALGEGRIRPRAGEPRPRGRGSRAGRAAVARDAAQVRARAGGCGLRLHPDRLSALAQPAHGQRAHRRAARPDPDAMRVLRARGPVRSGRHDKARALEPEPGPRDRGAAAHHVRPAQYAFAAGLTRARRALRRQSLPHASAAQCAPCRGAEPWRAGRSLGCRLQGRASLCRARWRSLGTRGGPLMKMKGLGRGLDALLGGEEARPHDALLTLPVARIRPGRYQPRTKMDQQALAELAASIRSQGLMQPLLVRPVDRDRYELIAGERRWRAAQMAGLEEVPTLVREVPDDAALAMSLIENIQRENLNPMEEAAGIQRLVDEFKMTHEQAADAVGRSRSATTNLLRLLKLARPVQEMLMEGALEMGHARALLALDAARQIEAGKRVAAKGLSVRETEALVQTMLRGPGVRRKRADRDLARLEEEIAERLGTTVEIRTGKKGTGKLVLHYSSLDHLDELVKKLR